MVHTTLQHDTLDRSHLCIFTDYVPWYILLVRTPTFNKLKWTMLTTICETKLKCNHHLQLCPNQVQKHHQWVAILSSIGVNLALRQLIKSSPNRSRSLSKQIRPNENVLLLENAIITNMVSTNVGLWCSLPNAGNSNIYTKTNNGLEISNSNLCEHVFSSA